MPHSLLAFTEAAGPVCLHLAERWRSANVDMDSCQRRNLEMATILVLRLIASDDPAAQQVLKRAADTLQE